MRRWLAELVSREVRDLREEVASQQRINRYLRQAYAEQIGETRAANGRAGLIGGRALELAGHLEHCIERRDRYHAAWRSARSRARTRGEALRVARVLLDVRYEQAKGATR